MAIRIEVSNALIGRLQQGDEKAFRAIYDQLHGRVYRMLLSLVKNREETEDLLQQTFVNLWVNRAKLNESQSLFPYIYLVAKRLAIDHFRKKVNEADAIAYFKARIDEHDDGMEESYSAADLQRFADDVISTLPPQQQRVFQLSRNEGLSYDEIAAHMQISKNTVKNHLVSALRQLRRHFVENDILYIYFLFFLSR